jgi:DNA polymerase V
LTKKVFALVDCNSFYCSCERLFRPDLKNVPVGVLSNNDGLFVSRTKELKKLGVGMGEPYFKVKELCKKHNVAVFSANFSLYTNLSDRVMNTLIKFTPELEVYSVDEAFLDLTGLEESCIDDYCREIKKIVKKDTGIPVSIGVGYTKTLAKVANHLAKKSEKSQGVVTLLNDRHMDIALKRTRVGDVWGIGRASERKMHQLSIFTALDLKQYKNKTLIQKIFSKAILQTKEELEGEIRFTLKLIPEKKKEIMCSRTFGKSIFDIQPLREAVANHITSASEKLRKQNSNCSKLEVYARTPPFKNTSQYYAYEQIILYGPTSNTLKLIRYALNAVEKLFKEGHEYKKAGVKLTNLVDINQTQLSLLDDNDTHKSAVLMSTIDHINRINGPNTIKSAACGVNNHIWKMIHKLRSPRYVTGFAELPKVN